MEFLCNQAVPIQCVRLFLCEFMFAISTEGEMALPKAHCRSASKCMQRIRASPRLVIFMSFLNQMSWKVGKFGLDDLPSLCFTHVSDAATPPLTERYRKHWQCREWNIPTHYKKKIMEILFLLLSLFHFSSPGKTASTFFISLNALIPVVSYFVLRNSFKFHFHNLINN